MVPFISEDFTKIDFIFLCPPSEVKGLTDVA